jgi:ASC-1-like (ASCH) protein
MEVSDAPNGASPKDLYMKQHILRLRSKDSSIYNDIVTGRKTVETRAATSKNRKIVRGDTIKFVIGKDSVVHRVQSVQHFDSVDEMLKVISLSHILPDAHSLEDALRVYDSFPGYKDKIKQYGILAFELGP